MWSVAMCVAAGVILVNGAAMAAESSGGPAAQAKCKKAEINPVTGHVFCIDPVGAPVEAPPADIAPPCKAEESRGQWSWAPTCNDEAKGM
jgi:hypothetical protein